MPLKVPVAETFVTSLATKKFSSKVLYFGGRFNIEQKQIKVKRVGITKIPSGSDTRAFDTKHDHALCFCHRK